MKRFYSFGFTLIELLVATAIIITATTIVFAILTSSFRSINKTTISEEVRQNGNSAISRMSRILQFADSFQDSSTDGLNYTPTCIQGTNYQSIRVKSGGLLRTLSCQNLSLDSSPSSPSSPLIDTAKVKVVAGSCRFTCIQDNSNVSPVIGIYFSLSEATVSVPEKSASITFSTTVKMRN